MEGDCELPRLLEDSFYVFINYTDTKQYKGALGVPPEQLQQPSYFC
jgi:hypothetical protein